MFSTPVDIPAVARARWLADVAETLDQAKDLLDRLKLARTDAALAVELAMRIEAAKHQVDSLRMSRLRRPNPDPIWPRLPPWEDDSHTGV